jgi:hypothetical protein
MPSAKSPSRKVLTQRLIPATLKTFKEAAKEQCRGLEGTVSYDGWTGDNHHHYIAFMVNCRGQVCLVNIRSDFNIDKRVGDRIMWFECMMHQENGKQQKISTVNWRRLLMSWKMNGKL